MVHTGLTLWRKILYYAPTPSPDRYWKKRKILKMAAHFWGRKRRIYKFAVVGVRRALRFATQARDQKNKDLRELREARLNAACEEHGFRYSLMKESLNRANILLNSKILSDLAIWEPRTFKCIADFAWKKAAEQGLNGINDLKDPPSGVILKPMPLK